VLGCIPWLKSPSWGGGAFFSARVTAADFKRAMRASQQHKRRLLLLRKDNYQSFVEVDMNFKSDLLPLERVAAKALHPNS